MASFHLTLSYRWDTAIIAGMGRYLECRKVANGLSPLMQGVCKKGIYVIFQSTFYLLARVETRVVLRCAINAPGFLKEQHFDFIKRLEITFNEIKKDVI